MRKSGEAWRPQSVVWKRVSVGVRRVGRSQGAAWRSGLVSESEAWSSQSVEARPCCVARTCVSCGESRRELACHAEGPSSTAATLAAVGTGRHDSPHKGTSRVQVTCTVSRDSFGLPSPTP